ncbi:hypothetical protein AB0953_17465 [Streptomyces sp. NPDC046866]|uniref:hypothetical protein n=1 Tax=Streptomyces sp. NPDC046866 TaxID=3154921 RepID=UPI00345697EB
MEPRVVYVHGSGNKVREELLKSRWDTALFGVGMGSASRMAYWAPLRHPAPLPETGPGSAAAGEAGGAGEPAAPGAEPAEEFLARVLAEARAEAAGGAAGNGGGAAGGAAGDGGGDRAAARSEAPLVGWLRDMTYLADALAEAGEAPPPAGGGAPEALPLPGPARTSVFRLLVEHAFKDVHAYFFGGTGPAVRDVVRRALDEAGAGAGAGGPLVVIGHNLGSIAAYELLREEQRQVDLLVTIGSPLGVTEVQEVLGRPPAVPAGVAAWRNASDPRDLVALDHTLRPEYAPVHLVSDHLVVNSSANHHGALEYLATGPVREPVRGLFGGLAVG